jgi:hypothetical protein
MESATLQLGVNQFDNTRFFGRPFYLIHAPWCEVFSGSQSLSGSSRVPVFCIPLFFHFLFYSTKGATQLVSVRPSLPGRVSKSTWPGSGGDWCTMPTRREEEPGETEGACTIQRFVSNLNLVQVFARKPRTGDVICVVLVECVMRSADRSSCLWLHLVLFMY